MEKENRVIQIHEHLRAGEANAITGRELSEKLDTDIRTITRLIETERREGFAICAKMKGHDAGYYMASNRKELNDYCSRLNKREKELRKTRYALQNQICKLPKA